MKEASMSSMNLNWAAIEADPKYYFLLPIGAAYYQELFKTQIWGPVNIGLVFALSEFIVAWSIAVIYSKKANQEFDVLAAEIIANAQQIGGKK
jgi:uncharacterized membrane protein (DUF485 family)